MDYRPLTPFSPGKLFKSRRSFLWRKSRHGHRFRFDRIQQKGSSVKFSLSKGERLGNFLVKIDWAVSLKTAACLLAKARLNSTSENLCHWEFKKNWTLILKSGSRHCRKDDIVAKHKGPISSSLHNFQYFTAWTRKKHPEGKKAKKQRSNYEQTLSPPGCSCHIVLQRGHIVFHFVPGEMGFNDK